MLYSFRQTISANTAFEDADEVEMKLSIGILRAVIVNIPAGVHQLARFQILDGIQNIIPSTEQMFITGDDSTPSIITHHKMERQPFNLTWKLWNVDETYNHTLYLMLILEGTGENLTDKKLDEMIVELQTLTRILSGSSETDDLIDEEEEAEEEEEPI